MIPTLTLDCHGRNVRTDVLDIECEWCSGLIRSGDVSLIGDSTFHAGRCDVLAAAAIAASVADGGGETVRDVEQAADILDRAARMLRARIAGRAS